MNRADLSELHFISEISNMPSIMEKGILCNIDARRLRHVSVALSDVQDKRDRKVVPGGLPLHEYANLYIFARNPMLSRIRARNASLCVLRVSTVVLDLPNVVIADGNAASQYTRFWPSPEGLEAVDADVVFAEYWTDNDQIAAWRKSRIRCAEVLVPKRVDPKFIYGAYVSGQEALRTFQAVETRLPVQINAHLFFGEGGK